MTPKETLGCYPQGYAESQSGKYAIIGNYGVEGKQKCPSYIINTLHPAEKVKLINDAGETLYRRGAFIQVPSETNGNLGYVVLLQGVGAETRLSLYTFGQGQQENCSDGSGEICAIEIGHFITDGEKLGFNYLGTIQNAQGELFSVVHEYKNREYDKILVVSADNFIQALENNTPGELAPIASRNIPFSLAHSVYITQSVFFESHGEPAMLAMSMDGGFSKVAYPGFVIKDLLHGKNLPVTDDQFFPKYELDSTVSPALVEEPDGTDKLFYFQRDQNGTTHDYPIISVYSFNPDSPMQGTYSRKEIHNAKGKRYAKGDYHIYGILPIKGTDAIDVGMLNGLSSSINQVNVSNFQLVKSKSYLSILKAAQFLLKTSDDTKMGVVFLHYSDLLTPKKVTYEVTNYRL